MSVRTPLSSRSSALVVLVILVVLATLVAACGSGGGSGGGSPTGGPTSGPGASGGPGTSTPPATQSPGPVTIDSPEEAAARAAALSPLLGGIGPKDPDLIGQAHWWEAVPSGDGWRVTFRVGWGDCPAGCIDEHTWVFDVAADGTVTPVSESGPQIPQPIVDELRSAGEATGVSGRVTAGPTCPVETPGDPACEPRAVAGAVLVVRGAGGVEVARLTTDAMGLFRLGLQPGEYTLEPQPVEGLMGTAAPMPFSVADGDETFLDVAYDTGIR